MPSSQRWKRRPQRRLPLLDGEPSLMREMVYRAICRAGAVGVSIPGVAAAIGISIEAAEKHVNDLQRYGFVLYRGRLRDGVMQHAFVSATPGSWMPPAG
jgi:hypothetical protein